MSQCWSVAGCQTKGTPGDGRIKYAFPLLYVITLRGSARRLLSLASPPPPAYRWAQRRGGRKAVSSPSFAVARNGTEHCDSYAASAMFYSADPTEAPVDGSKDALIFCYHANCYVTPLSSSSSSIHYIGNQACSRFTYSFHLFQVLPSSLPYFRPYGICHQSLRALRLHIYRVFQR
jgi:hypothetical protein